MVADLFQRLLKQPPRSLPGKVCPTCGEPVEGSDRRRYCSDSCRVLAWYRRNRDSYLARQRANRRAGRWV